MSEIVTIKATKGKNGKYYYYKSTGDPDPNGYDPLYTVRIAKEEFDDLAKKKRNYDKEFDEEKNLIKFKYVDARFEKWQAQEKRAAERKAQQEKSNKKTGCAGIFIFGFGYLAWLLCRLL